MKQLFRNALEETSEAQRAVLVSVFPKNESPSAREASLSELVRLLETAGGTVYAKLIQCRDHPENATYLGSGKIKELSALCTTGGVSLVVCDDELTPTQIKNLEDLLDGEVQVIDRSMLILDIFALHAASADGKLQVELAQLKYSAPRLVGKGRQLSRLGGGIGTRGPGESKLESDRRHLNERIRILEDQLETLTKCRDTQRKQREKSGIFRFAIAGYTNAGKSTLLNALTGAGVKEKDELFATLDPTTRKYEFPSGTEVLLTDTVGFIRNLPHHLIKAFRSTLDEVAMCDAILLVLDISDPEVGAQLKVTLNLLKDLDAADKPVLYVLNKCDKAETTVLPFIGNAEKRDIVSVSARTGEGLQRLIKRMEEMSSEQKKRVKLKIPMQDIGILSKFYDKGTSMEVQYTADSAIAEMTVDRQLLGKYARYIVN